MANQLWLPSPAGILLGHYFASSRAGLALDSNYTYNSAGDAVGFDFVAPLTEHLSTVYFYVTAANGTPGNLTVELRSYAGSRLPGATLHASQTVSPGTTANKWIACTFGTPYECAAGVHYMLVIGDAAGTGTNYATVAYSGGVSVQSEPTIYIGGTPSYSTAGYSAAGSAGNGMPLVIKFADGTIMGHPYDTSGTDTSNALMRGLHIEGLTEQLTVRGVAWNGVATGITGLKIFKGTAGPDDAADFTWTFDASDSLRPTDSAAYFTPYTFAKDTIYNVVFTYGSSQDTPGYYQNTDGAAQADTIACGFGGGTMYRCIDASSSNAWALDTSKFPRMALIVQDQVAITAGGGVPMSRVFTGM